LFFKQKLIKKADFKFFTNKSVFIKNFVANNITLNKVFFPL